MTRDGDDGQSCTVRDNSDGTATIECPDGTETTFSTQGGGAKGDPGEKGNVGDKGESVVISERDLLVGDSNCPKGGKAIDFFEGAAMTPSATSYMCNAVGGQCHPGQVLDATLKYCISMFEVEFDGTISEALVSELPAALRPNTTATCSGKISFPTGLTPTSSFSAGGAFDAAYTFGHVAAYGNLRTLSGTLFSNLSRLTEKP